MPGVFVEVPTPWSRVARGSHPFGLLLRLPLETRDCRPGEVRPLSNVGEHPRAETDSTTAPGRTVHRLSSASCPVRKVFEVPGHRRGSEAG